jgi:pyruvate/2-oxoacid:ferredoxin oxidoreductase alpha subunit
MESEHSAMAACLAASLSATRTFTATSSQGLALMHEMLHFTSGCRAPVVMACVNRSLAAPWGFWSDQTDTLAQRDTGWIQIYCENNQETLDSVIQAFRISEEVLLPCMVVLEANFISHFMEPVEVPEQELVDKYLPPVNLPLRFDVEQPAFIMPVVNQSEYRKYRRLSQEAMELSQELIVNADSEYSVIFGRQYGHIEAVATEDAEVVLVTSGSITSTARVVLASMRKNGLKVGLVKIRVFRPFPSEILRDALADVPKIAVIDRNISLGREGIFCSELKAALCDSASTFKIQGYLAGIGGTNVSPDHIERIALDALNREEITGKPIWIMEE